MADKQTETTGRCTCGRATLCVPGSCPGAWERQHGVPTQTTGPCPYCGAKAEDYCTGGDDKGRCHWPRQQTPTTDAPNMLEREKLFRDALHDAMQAVECIEAGDWLRADILLKLAIDQLDDTGLIPVTYKT